MAGIAEKINIEVNRMRGSAALYRLTPPMEDEDGKSVAYVVVSAVTAPVTGPETFIFAANDRGDIESWHELPGSFRGDLDHVAALENAGYRVAP
jgi:hypothetical protein